MINLFNPYKTKLALHQWRSGKYNKEKTILLKYCNLVTIAMVTPGAFPFNILTDTLLWQQLNRAWHSYTGGSDRPLEDRDEIVKADL